MSAPDATGGDGDAGRSGPVEQLLPVVYEELRAIARRERLRLSGGETLATTALIHEAWLKLSGASAFESRSHFLKTASVAMRHILIDRVKLQFRAKRGGGEGAISLDEIPDFTVADGDTVMAVHEALEELARLNPVLVSIVECRFFAGYSEIETAEAMGISERSVQRHWATARAWLKKELAP